MSAMLQFTLGLDRNDFLAGVAQSGQAVNGFTPKLTNMASGISHGGHEMLEMRERSEILRNSLELMGGPIGQLASLSRMMLSPMTIGFAAVFGGVELVSRSLEKASERMREFVKHGTAVEAIVKGIISARPTNSEEWVAIVKEMGKLTERGSNLNFVSSQFDDVAKGQEKNKADAIQAQIELEQQKVELLRQQGQISEADAARRIAALKDQAVLQKNIAEQNAIKADIGAKKSDLAEMTKLARENPEGAAFQRKQQADANVADLQKQIEDLPKAIAGAKKLQSEAEEKAKGTYLNPRERFNWIDQSEQAGSRVSQLQAALDKAKADFAGAVSQQTSANEGFQNAQTYSKRSAELNQEIVGLHNSLRVAQDRQSKLTPAELEKNRLASLAAQSKDMNKTLMPHSLNESAGTAFEKMGFVMNGTSSLASQQLDVLKQIRSAVERGNMHGGGGVAGGGMQFVNSV